MNFNVLIFLELSVHLRVICYLRVILELSVSFELSVHVTLSIYLGCLYRHNPDIGVTRATHCARNFLSTTTKCNGLILHETSPFYSLRGMSEGQNKKKGRWKILWLPNSRVATK